MTPVETRDETGAVAACKGAHEKASRKRRMQAALDRGDTAAYMHERLAFGFASSDQERGARYVVPVEPAPRATTRPPRQRRDRRLNGRRTASRRTASRSAGGSSSGDPDLPGEPPPPPLASTGGGR